MENQRQIGKRIDILLNELGWGGPASNFPVTSQLDTNTVVINPAKLLSRGKTKRLPAHYDDILLGNIGMTAEQKKAIIDKQIASGYKPYVYAAPTPPANVVEAQKRVAEAQARAKIEDANRIATWNAEQKAKVAAAQAANIKLAEEFKKAKAAEAANTAAVLEADRIKQAIWAAAEKKKLDEAKAKSLAEYQLKAAADKLWNEQLTAAAKAGILPDGTMTPEQMQVLTQTFPAVFSQTIPTETIHATVASPGVLPYVPSSVLPYVPPAQLSPVSVPVASTNKNILIFGGLAIAGILIIAIAASSKSKREVYY